MHFVATPMSPPTSDSAERTPESPLRLPMTPPLTYRSSKSDATESLGIALHTMRTERDALDYLQELYAKSEVAQKGLSDAVDAILDSQIRFGKLIISGVGKSAIVARKAVATLTRLNIQCRFLDPLAALHGDLGMISEVTKSIWRFVTMLMRWYRMIH